MAKDISARLISALPRLRRFALSLAGRRDVADYLVQISCEKALANAGSWQEGTQFDAWIFRILRNTWIDQTRRRKTEGRTEDIYLREDLVGLRGDKDIENRLMLQKVWEIIGTLPDDQREVLLLVCVEGLTYNEAAEVLEVPAGTVMSRLARARTKIAALSGIND
jgi:RNA polymerase sigma-70 factor (ECF subfamily)